MIFFLIFLSILHSCSSDLLSVQVVSSAGDSLPTIDLPNLDIPGTGRITKQGQKRMALIGDVLRSRYITNSSLNTTVHSQYDTQWHTFRATPFLDAKDSVNALVYGLFPPGTGQSYNGSYLYVNGTTIVAVHSSRINQDTLLFGHADCPTAFYQSYKNMVSDAWEDIIEDNEELIESIEDLTGYSLEQTDSNNETETAEKTYSLLEAMHDLKFMNDSNYPLPDALSSVLGSESDKLFRDLFYQRFRKRNTDHCYGAVGFLMYTLMVLNPADDIEFWKNQTAEENHTLYHHYSTDRATLNLLHSCLGFDIDEDDKSLFPEFGAQYIFELHYNTSSDENMTSPYLKIYYVAAPSLSPSESMYRDITSTHALHTDTIDLSYFREKLSYLDSQLGSSADDFAFDLGACGRQEKESISTSREYTYIAFFAVFVVIFIALAVGLIISVCIRVRNRKARSGKRPDSL